MDIERDIPIPPAGKNRVRSECGRTVRAMQAGESVFCETEEEKERVRSCMVNVGFRYITRKMDGGWRVWRMS